MDDPFQVTLREVRLDLFEALNIPHALSLAICLRYKQWDELYRLCKCADTVQASSKLLPHRNISYERAFLQANALISKSNDLPPVPFLEEAALASFYECEQKNRETNIRFLCNEVPSNLIYMVHQITRDILGDFSELDWAQNFRFGPGASSTCRGESATIVDKLASDIQCTPRAYERLERGFRHFFQFYYSLGSFTTGLTGSYLTIDKKFDERRGICISQHGNIVGQLGLGAVMRRKFRRYVDLDNAADYHRKLVRTEWQSIATIDMRRASQLIARRAVQAGFPSDWVEVMDDLREEYTHIPNLSDVIYSTDVIHYNQHYSAMGNGFTFEMESILFYAVAKAAMLNAGVKWKILSVFGDDVIVDQEHAQIVISALEAFGFEINQSKTFIDGPFKESCGVDTLYGRNVRAVYLRNLNEGQEIERLYKLANCVFTMAVNSGHGICADSRFYRAWKRVVQQIPEHRRFYGTWTFKHPDTSGARSAFIGLEISDSVLAYAAGRNKPQGKLNRYQIGRRYHRGARKYGTGEIWLGAALLGASSHGCIVRNSPRYRVIKQKLRYKLPPVSLVWA